MYFDYMNPCCDLDLEYRNIFFFLLHDTLHHYTKFGNKMFCSSDDIIRTNNQQQFEPLL